MCNRFLGILVDNGRLRHRTNVERVLFVYSFHAFEKAAVKVALELAQDPKVHLTIIVPRQAAHHDHLQQRLNSPDFTTLGGLLQMRQRAESDTAASTSDDDNQAHHKNDKSDGVAKPTKKKGPAWYEYFDIVFLMRLLVRIVQAAWRRLVAPGSGTAGGQRRSAAHASRSPVTVSLPLRPSKDDLEMAEQHTPYHTAVRLSYIVYLSHSHSCVSTVLTRLFFNCLY
jgi:hypothetical protein